MNPFRSLLNPIVQRTAGSTPVSPIQQAAFINAAKDDINELVRKYNNLSLLMFQGLKPVLQADGKTPLDYGITGEVIYTHRDAYLGANEIYWDQLKNEPKSIKESFDGILGKINNMQIDVDKIKAAEANDTTAIEDELASISSNLLQNTRDTFGSDYILENNSSGVLTYSVAQALDAIGSLFDGWPGLGLTYDSTFPTLSFAINLSDITFDINLPQSLITNLTGHLSNIRTYTGMSGASDSSPTYSAYYSTRYLSDGMSLTQAISTLEEAISTIDNTYDNGALLVGDGSNVPASMPSKFFADVANTRIGIGTNAPETSLDVRGRIKHVDGIISRGGNTRGTGVADLQTSRTLATQVASGNYCVVIGKDNTASGDYSCAIGNSNSAVSPSAVAIGDQNTASAASAISIGMQNSVTAETGVALGYHNSVSAIRGIATGAYAVADVPGGHAHASGYFATAGDAQVVNAVLRNTTVGAVTNRLYLNGSSAEILTADGYSYSIVARIIAKTAVAVGADTNHYIIEGTVQRDTGVGTIGISGALTKRVIHEDMPGADATISVDTATGAISIEGTGIAGATIRWVASVTVTRVGF